MIYLIGGVSRSGKSTICKKIHQHTGLPYISTDVIMAALIESGNYYNIDYKLDSDLSAKQMWSFVKSFLVQLNKQEQHYLVEGISLWPTLVQEIKESCEIKDCYLGYHTIDTHVKLAQLRGGYKENNAWHNTLNDEMLIEHIENIKLISQRLRADCELSDAVYFESMSDIESISKQVMTHFELV